MAHSISRTKRGIRGSGRNSRNISRSLEIPDATLLRKELDRLKYKDHFLSTLHSTVFTLVNVAAISILVAVLLLPVLHIYGTSMEPTLSEGDLVVSIKGASFETGDVIAFYYNNKILVKRAIANAGDWVDISEDGTVYVNNREISEPYIQEKAFGECNITLPYQVPEGKTFVMGDNRDVSIDSRNTAVGCVSEEQIVGKIVCTAWPLNHFHFVDNK